MKPKQKSSLKWQIVGIVLTCWLVPVVLVLAVMGWYVADTLSQRTTQTLSDQLQLNLRMCDDRLESAVTASRAASTDATIKTAWNAFGGNDHYLSLYRATRTFMDLQYRTDSRFRLAVFWFSDYPERKDLGVYNQSVGGRYQDLSAFWAEDQTDAAALADALGTSIGFLSRDGRVYLVRNVMDPKYNTIGTLALSLNLPYFFEDLTALPWVSDLNVTLNGIPLRLKGDQPLAKADGVLHQTSRNGDCALELLARVDYKVLLSQVSGYRYLLGGLALLLLPILVVVFRFFRRKISRPMEEMTAGAHAIEGGALGHQLVCDAGSREFQYLTESFNHMSGQLQSQFDRLYQEELALRDARIKALQSHISPHFLNNTLEIINWEARMNGDARVSKMIEALSTVLDAAIARDKRPEVPLAEELGYVSAYLYIIGERFGKRLTILREIDDATLTYMVPRLILQPVIENSVEHGIGLGGQGVITLRSRLENDLLLLEIENNGGLSPEDEAHIASLLNTGGDTSKESSGNIGISNVNQRLRILYGGPSGLTIGRGEGDLVVARLTISPKEP